MFAKLEYQTSLIKFPKAGLRLSPHLKYSIILNCSIVMIKKKKKKKRKKRKKLTMKKKRRKKTVQVI